MDSDDELLALLGDEPALAPASKDDPFEALGIALNDATDVAPVAPPLHNNVQDKTNVMRDVPPMMGGLPMPTAGGLASELADCAQDESFEVSDLGSRVTLNEDGTSQVSDDVRCYHPLYRPHGCYAGRGINFKQARNGRSLFYICDECGDKWNQIPPSDLKPGENPKVTSSKRRTDNADPTRCGGYHCTTCGHKKNKKLASELGVPHCICPKKDKEGEKEEGEGEEEGLGLPSLSKLPAALPPIPMPPPMSASDAAKQAALEAVRVCRMMGGAQFTTPTPPPTPTAGQTAPPPRPTSSSTPTTPATPSNVRPGPPTSRAPTWKTVPQP